MEKVKQWLFEALLLGITVRSFIAGASLSDALVCITLIAGIIYTKEYLFKHKVNDRQILEDRMTILGNEIASLKLDRAMRRAPTTISQLGAVTNEQPQRRF